MTTLQKEILQIHSEKSKVRALSAHIGLNTPNQSPLNTLLNVHTYISTNKHPPMNPGPPVKLRFEHWAPV